MAIAVTEDDVDRAMARIGIPSTHISRAYIRASLAHGYQDNEIATLLRARLQVPVREPNPITEASPLR